ncbi:ribosomal RNA-processing protein 14-C [Sesamum indicum]|uniref:Ribosomal RNA-processing protein 14-C n=1 Tax=Sesamum indicum TaxID=4182 RepID=A0A6I9TAP5_SESIN|nr:ribosomal RNA-processing protein 14-C [Sesamum indicum]
MKKKKQKPTTPNPAADEFGGDLKSIIHAHSEYFDHLIELIPPRFYLSNDDADSKPWYQGLSKAAKASLKQQSKQNLKLARRQRFDPDKEPSSTLQLLQQQQNNKTPVPGESNFTNLEDGESGAKPVDVEENKKSVTYEELREKLRRKIELLRGNRGEKKNDEKKLKNDGNKRKRDGENDGGQSGKGVHLDEDEDGEEIIEYGKVRLGDEEEGKQGKKKKRKLPKAKELERVKRTEEVKRENPSAAERESWKAATSRAMGVKVHDSARLIKESMKKEKRKREKNKEKWKERVETQEKMKEEKQRKRKENIVGRINEKKMRKIAKREKKLMRPGFEGRKEGFITPE